VKDGSESRSIRAVRPRPSAGAVFVEALWLGMLGFGGGISVLAMIRNRTVEKRRWLTEKEFANAATIGQMLPGGASANTLAYIGLRFQGQAGALAGYLGFILPGFFAVLGLAWAYVKFGKTPNVDAILGGFNAAVVGIITGITMRMVKTGVPRLWQMGVASGALLLGLVGGASPAEVALLGIAAGLVIDLLIKTRRARALGLPVRVPPAALPEEGQPLPGHDGKLRSIAVVLVLAAALGVMDGHLVKLGLVFFRTGLGAYGGGFAIIPHLKTVVIDNHWLTQRQFADAVAMGKLTPGPVLLMATFIGYQAGGLPAAILATLSIFLGPYLLVVGLGTWLNRVRSRIWVRAALRGLTPAVVGLMAASVLTLGDSLRGSVEFGLAAAVALTTVRFEVNPVLLLALGGLVRLVLGRFVP
jgi:chromate transporter